MENIQGQQPESGQVPLITFLLQLHKIQYRYTATLVVPRKVPLWNLATNMLHSLFSVTLILPKNLHLRFAITDSEGRQLNISRHVSTTSRDLVSKICPHCAINNKIQRL